jgi:hypothetical protein
MIVFKVTSSFMNGFMGEKRNAYRVSVGKPEGI